MSAKFLLTAAAIKDIEKIADYLSQESNFERAEQFLEALNAKFVRISQFPNLGRPRNEIFLNLRSLPIENYLILYIPGGQDVEILRVVSGYQDLSALFDD